MTDMCLEHHGVKGQKWGVRRTPAQLGHKTTSKRKKSGIFSKLAKNSKKKAAKAKKTKEAKKEESREEIRAKLLRSTDPKFISKHMDLLETKELQERIDRITKESTMKKLASSKDSDKIKKGENALKTIASMAESASKTVDAINKISDAANKANKQSIEDRAKNAQERAKAREEKAKKDAINKALSDLNKAGNVENISPDKLMSSINTANKAYDTIKSFSDIEISFDPRTGEPKFKKKKS